MSVLPTDATFKPDEIPGNFFDKSITAYSLNRGSTVTAIERVESETERLDATPNDQNAYLPRLLKESSSNIELLDRD